MTLINDLKQVCRDYIERVEILDASMSCADSKISLYLDKHTLDNEIRRNARLDQDIIHANRSDAVNDIKDTINDIKSKIIKIQELISDTIQLKNYYSDVD